MKCKRLLSFVLLIALCVSMIPSSVFAAGTEENGMPEFERDIVGETDKEVPELKNSSPEITDVNIPFVEQYTNQDVMSVSGSAIKQQLIPQSLITATANSVHNPNPASNAVDGNANTFWDAGWESGDIGIGVKPIVLTLTLDKTHRINQFTYLTRQDDGWNGTVSQYSLIVVKPDGSEITVKTESFTKTKEKNSVEFEPIDAIAVKLVVAQAYTNGGTSNTLAVAAEVNLYEMIDSLEISESALTLKTEESHLLVISGAEEESVIWSSSNPSVASVDAEGNVTGLSEGTALITAISASNKIAECDVSISNQSIPSKPGYVLVFSDDFDGSTLDSSKWNNWCVDLDKSDYWRYNNSPDSVVAPENVKVEDGSLRLLGTKDPVEFNGITSTYKMGAVQTRDLFQPTYGYMETMVKIPDVAGSNPAIWTMPKRTDDGSDWSWGEPAFPGDNDYKFGAEIDILERPHPDGNSSYADLVDKYHLTIHYDNYAFDKHTKFHKEPTLNAPYKWHKFSMEWTPEYINFYVDGKLVETQDKDVPNQEEILILSYGLGGWIGTVAPDMVYSEMMVDYVRWYQVDPVTAKMNTNFLTVNIEETKTLTIEIVEDGKTVDVTDPVISWVSSNPSIASVDNNGNITGLLEGTATITATTQSGRTDTCDVSVSEVGKVKPGYKLVFEDNFSGDKLDNTKWNNWCVDLTKPEPFRYANSKEVALVPENAYVKDGSLRLLGSKEETIFENEEPSQYRMGAVHTKDIFEPTYGYMETMVRIPNVPGSNPAIWTMPRASEKGGWQWDSDNGSGKFGAEIDILERPHPEGDSQYAGLNDKYWITMHYDNYEFTNHTKYHVQPAINNPYEWHKFGMEWTPEYINFILDGKIMATQNKDVPNSPEIFILSYGLGGWIGKIADQKLPAEMIVDYVRWYQIDKTSVQVVPNKLDLKAGESKQLEVQFTPQNTTDKVEQWISSKDSIASVDENGKVTAQSNGSVKIRLITVEGRIATCDVTVTGYSDGDGSTPVPFPTQPINTGNPTDPSVIDTPQISTSTEATENGGSLEKTTTITTDSNGNIQMETVIIEKDKNGTVLGKTIQISKEDKRAGTTVTVEAKQDAQGKVLEPKVSVTETKALIEVNGSKSSVNVVLNVDFINQMIKDSKVPVQLSISVAPSTVFDQLRDRNIKDIVLNITVPNALDLNYKTKIQTITLEKEVIHLAKSGGKNISAIIRDEKGKENYSWTFKSSILKNSKCKIDDVNLALAVTTIKSLTEDKVMKDQVSKISPNGIAIAFSHTGLLPSTAKVKVYVGDKKGFTEGKKVYLYYYNKSVNKLDKLAKEEYKIEKGGYITLNITHCSNYVILPVRANNARGLLSQVYVPTKQMIKKGKSSLKIVNPSTLKIVSRYSINNDPGVTEALVTYKSSKTSVASISSNGKITAKKIGTTKIKVNMELQDGTKKSIVVNVKVK